MLWVAYFLYNAVLAITFIRSERAPLLRGDVILIMLFVTLFGLPLMLLALTYYVVVGFFKWLLSS